MSHISTTNAPPGRISNIPCAVDLHVWRTSNMLPFGRDLKNLSPFPHAAAWRRSWETTLVYHRLIYQRVHYRCSCPSCSRVSVLFIMLYVLWIADVLRVPVSRVSSFAVLASVLKRATQLTDIKISMVSAAERFVFWVGMLHWYKLADVLGQEGQIETK